MKMGAPTGGGEEKSPPEKKTKAGRGSIKKRLSIGYNFSSLRKRNPPKGVFEEDEGKKKAQPKTVSVKVGDLGWKQTTHVGQEEAQQLKALMSLMQQLGDRCKPQYSTVNCLFCLDTPHHDDHSCPLLELHQANPHSGHVP